MEDHIDSSKKYDPHLGVKRRGTLRMASWRNEVLTETFETKIMTSAGFGDESHFKFRKQLK